MSHVGGFVSGTLCDTSLSPGAELESPEDLLKRRPLQQLQLFIPCRCATGRRSGGPVTHDLLSPRGGRKPRARKKQEPCRLQAVPSQALGLPGATYSCRPRSPLGQCDAQGMGPHPHSCYRSCSRQGPLSPDPRGSCRWRSQGQGATLSSTSPASQRVREDTRS